LVSIWPVKAVEVTGPDSVHLSPDRAFTRQTAHDIFTGILSSPSVITYYDAVKITADIAFKSWHRKWDLDVTGFYTRWLIPIVGTKVTFPEKRSIGISYSRLLLHDTLLRKDSYRTGTADTPFCECGFDTESAEHFLLHCTRFQEARRKLQDILDEISDTTSRKK